ncbi:hypothetical protein PHLGIDRAFT_189035 [Phlebiopsis gigantea 11061_1 CR5-6]|uniref:Uncharacterized protein n=1 Tax=Phlebiopsis gigantea (strain 11061_1 CR5-6) TaxID=745531 RepID=A0A0C3PG12_PHLG1|nr:hypothetical protein PHLGIDRAFT_189035 [Phlebiopsis gigantea 11061_1 CR5-6]
MPSIIVHRFLLNLRQLNDKDDSPPNSDAQHFSRFSVPNFRIRTSGMWGNMGEPLVHGPEDQIDDEDTPRTATPEADRAPSDTRSTAPNDSEQLSPREETSGSRAATSISRGGMQSLDYLTYRFTPLTQ